MSYIGNPIVSQAFLTDQFSGTGSATSFILTVAPANSASILVAVSGVLQDPSTYGVAGTTLTFSSAPPSGTANISVRYLGIPATGVTSTAYRTITEITATASQTTFTPASYTVGFLNVYQNGVLLGSADYTATNGTTVVLATGATVGDLLLFESFNVSSVLNAIPATPGAVNPSYLAAAGASKAFLDTANSDGTGGMIVPTGTTAQRPATPVAGTFRYNTSTNQTEVYSGIGWTTITAQAVSASYLVVAGGGGGGGTGTTGNGAAGGGAGGLLTSTTSLTPATVYAITVGAGGAGGSASAKGTSGNNSIFSAIAISLGGGGGGSGQNTYENGLSGGSGGGGAPYTSAGVGGSGTSGQGNAGGNGLSSSPNYAAGGGGGAGAVGTNATSTAGGAGGVGLSSSITGSGVYYAGGGGGGVYQSGTAGAGGNGGGGNAGAGGGNNAGSAGSANSGGGGGGASINSSVTTISGGAGGSGVVILSVPTAQYTGTTTGSPTVTTSGANTIMTFTTSGSYTA